MKGDNLQYWRWVKAQRQADLTLELARDEDPNLIKSLKQQVTEAEAKIQELE